MTASTDQQVRTEPLDHHGGDRLRGLHHAPSGTTGRFIRMFPQLPALDLDDQTLTELATTMVDPTGGGGWSGQPTPADNPSLPAGYTYLAQFVDHDLTFDPTSRRDRINDPDALTNFRTPRFDLDSVYGGGPKASPFLYDQTDPDKLLIAGTPAGPNLAGRDLPRNSQGRALIGDPRNDVHVIIAQLHLAVLAFHNAVVEHVRTHPELRWGDETVFQTTCRLVRWHYQWVVLQDLLPRLVGRPMVDSVLQRRRNRWTAKLRLYHRQHRYAYIPIEFSAAVFRFGHSLVRDAYQLNASSGLLPVFAADEAQPDLHGFRPIEENMRIEWRRFFPGLDGSPPADDASAGGDIQPSMRLDTRLAPSLTHPPTTIDEERRSIALLNLFRGDTLGLPSGEDVASAVAAKVPDNPPSLQPGQIGLDHAAPLWFHILKEADVLANGTRLGPVGGRIVTEVFVGLLLMDKSCWLVDHASFTPVLPSAVPSRFAIADLLRMAGAVP